MAERGLDDRPERISSVPLLRDRIWHSVPFIFPLTRYERRTGFRGALNYYRNIDRNWELTAPFAGAPVTVPALYVAGDRDLVVSFPGMDQLLANLKHFVPALHNTLLLPGCGHWTQQERPSEVNAALRDFLRALPS